MGEKVLVIGGGGREHALGWSISQSPEVSEVIFAKGNPGTALDDKCCNIDWDGGDKANFSKLFRYVKETGIGMVVVGAENPLVDGVVNHFNRRGYHNIFGPTSKAAGLEADKWFSYDVMEAAGVPQARAMKCSDLNSMIDLIRAMPSGEGVVIKARGLTGGKGVFVYDDKKHAFSRIEADITSLQSLDVLVAERLFGPEASIFGISDGERVIPLEMSVQDHKRLLDNDKGPNTGGMGAYGPAHFADSKTVQYIADKIMTPVIQEMKKRGIVYKGFLYAGMMETKEGWKVIEFNCRFGDPEAQPSVMMLKNGLYQPLRAALDGKLGDMKFEFNPGAACCVVMASNGYPGDYGKEYLIGGLEEVAKLKDVKVFHAGTALNKEGKIVTNGGRVLSVTAQFPRGINYAQSIAYEAVQIIDQATTELNNRKIFIYRTDIAHQAVRR